MLGLFFGVMFTANGALIYTALSTLHGEELANSFDASQVYNQRIAEARAQNLLGWVADVTTRQEGGGERVVADFKGSRRRADRRAWMCARASCIRSTRAPIAKRS